MRSSFTGKFGCILVFGLLSLGALCSQATLVQDVRKFAVQCIAREDPANRVTEAKIIPPLTERKNEKIFFVTTANGPEYVIKVIDLKEFSPDHLDDFRGSQLMHRYLQDKILPSNLQFALARFCQVVDDLTIYGIEDEFSPPPEGQLMVWMSEAPGNFIGNLRAETAGENLDKCLQSIAQADAFLYQHKIFLSSCACNNRVDFESGMVTITNVAGVKIDPSSEFQLLYALEGFCFLNRLALHPEVTARIIDCYETPSLKQRVEQIFHSQIQTFAQQCLASEDLENQIVDIQEMEFGIKGKHKAIFFVTTVNGPEYVVKVIDLKDFPNGQDEFRSSQLMYRYLQDKILPPNLQFALIRFCQVVGDSRVYGIEDEFLPTPSGELMLWASKAPGDFIDNLQVENAEKNLDECLQSIAQADTFLYRHRICVRTNACMHRVDFESGMLTIVNVAGVKIDPPGGFHPSYMFGGYRFLNQFILYPNVIAGAIGFYEDLDLRQHVRQEVMSGIADRFNCIINYFGGHDLSLDQIIALIDQYRGMDLIPGRIGMGASECLGPILTKEEFVKILLTNLPDEHKTALQTMYEQQIPKAEVQRGNADPQICEAFQHYLSRVYGVRPAESDWFRNPGSDYGTPILDVIQYGRNTSERVLENYYKRVDPEYAFDLNVGRCWRLVFK
ncbi:MAG: hypothetical protein LBJ78_01845 [Puniceicoccales bacterium]|jgi:hypothetical protein|nr:hypothetical protein [Puniceicoccales bacterium]